MFGQDAWTLALLLFVDKNGKRKLGQYLYLTKLTSSLVINADTIILVCEQVPIYKNVQCLFHCITILTNQWWAQNRTLQKQAKTAQ